MIVQYTIQLSIAEQKSHDDLEAKQNEEKAKEHLIAEEIEKMVEGIENVETMSYKERLEVEKTAVEQPVNVIEEEVESAEDDYELKRREKPKKGRMYRISLDLSRLATTLNRLERSIQTGINKWYQSLLRNFE
ncbi:hypothetical protein Tco_0520553 [Tanacetum coccineum]